MQVLARLSYPVVLLLVFTVFFFVGLDGPIVIDYAEAVYAEVSREMYLTGDPLVPKLNGEDFFENPPLLYWLQMLGYDLFGISALGARFFNAVCGLLTVLALYFGARGPLGHRTAFHAALIMGSSIIFVCLARVAMTDMVLTLFLTLCLLASWYGIERVLRQRNGAGLFWLGCLFAGIAMLSKGVIGALFPILTALIYLISIRQPALLFRPNWVLPGTLILVVVAFSWYLILSFVHPEGFSFSKELFVKHHFGRFFAVMEEYSGPLYYYLIVLAIGFMPWFSYLPHAVITAPLADRQHPADRFLRLFAIFTGLVLIFFSLAAAKLPNYILPALPGLALLLAVLFNKETAPPAGPWRYAGWFAALSAGLLGLVFATLPLVFPYLHEILGKDARKAPILAETVELGAAPWLTSGLLFFCCFLILRIRGNTDRQRVFETLLLCSLIISGALFHLMLPLYDRLMNAPLARIASQAAAQVTDNDTLVVYAIDHRPSINFVSGHVTVSRAERDYRDVPGLFQPPGSTVGITTAYYLQRLHDYGFEADELSRDGGYVLFRVVPGEPSQPPDLPRIAPIPER